MASTSAASTLIDFLIVTTVIADIVFFYFFVQMQCAALPEAGVYSRWHSLMPGSPAASMAPPEAGVHIASCSLAGRTLADRALQVSLTDEFR